jgi:hypothetical protein
MCRARPVEQPLCFMHFFEPLVFGRDSGAPNCLFTCALTCNMQHAFILASLIPCYFEAALRAAAHYYAHIWALLSKHIHHLPGLMRPASSSRLHKAHICFFSFYCFMYGQCSNRGADMETILCHMITRSICGDACAGTCQQDLKTVRACNPNPSLRSPIKHCSKDV